MASRIMAWSAEDRLRVKQLFSEGIAVVSLAGWRIRRVHRCATTTCCSLIAAPDAAADRARSAHICAGEP
jgi:hypothetical protein